MSYMNISFTNQYVRATEPAHAHGFDYGISREGGRPDHISLTSAGPGATELTSQPLPLEPSLEQSAAPLAHALLGAGVDSVTVTHAGTGHPDIATWTSRFSQFTTSARVTQAPAGVRALIDAANKFQPVVDAEYRAQQK